MAVAGTNIVVYAAADMPTSDSATTGGAVDSGIRVTFTDIIATDQIEVVSASASDTQNMTIAGRAADGTSLSETITLSGTTVVTTSSSFERVLSATLVSAAVGTVTVRDADTDEAIASIPQYESGILRPFNSATANAAGGAAKTLYEKCFIKNNNASSALLSTTVVEVSSGLYTIMTFGLEDSLNSIQTVTDRTTAPTGVTGGFGSASSGLPVTNLTPTDSNGMWLKLELAAGASAQNSFYQFQVNGTTA
jgi:hypothetical protein